MMQLTLVSDLADRIRLDDSVLVFIHYLPWYGYSGIFW
jgi:hypothetical protein